jgi:hypothetical protein
LILSIKQQAFSSILVKQWDVKNFRMHFELKSSLTAANFNLFMNRIFEARNVESFIFFIAWKKFAPDIK